MIIDNSKIKLIALIGFVCTITLGVPAFMIVLGLAFIFYLARPSAYLGLLFISGPIKVVPLIQASPVDITLLAYLLFILYFLFQRVKGGIVQKNILPVWIILGFCFIVVLSSLITTPAPWSYISKSGILIILLYIPMIFMVTLLPAEQIQKNIQNLLQLSLLIGYAWLGVGLHNDFTGYSPLPSTSDYRFSAFGEDYMLFTLFAIPLVLEALIAFFFKEKYLVNGILLLILSYCMLNSPARGLTIDLIVASIFIGFIYIYKPTSKKLILAASLSISIVLSILAYARFFISTKHEIAVQRLSNFDLSGVSINNRFTSIKVAWEHWKDHVLFGTGTDSVAFFNNDPGLYTHNLVLEAIFEYGLIGAIPIFALILISLIFFYAIIKKLLIERSSLPASTCTSIEVENLLLKIWFAAMFIVLLLFSMTSGTLGTMRPFWISLALTIATGFSVTTKNSTNRT